VPRNLSKYLPELCELYRNAEAARFGSDQAFRRAREEFWSAIDAAAESVVNDVSRSALNAVGDGAARAQRPTESVEAVTRRALNAAINQLQAKRKQQRKSARNVVTEQKRQEQVIDPHNTFPAGHLAHLREMDLQRPPSPSRGPRPVVKPRIRKM